MASNDHTNFFAKMAITVAKKKTRRIRNAENIEPRTKFQDSAGSKYCSRIPAVLIFLFLIFLWSSSTTIISGSIVHVCVTSRKLGNHLYCLSAGTQPSDFHVSLPGTTNITSSEASTQDIKSKGLTSKQQFHSNDIFSSASIKEKILLPTVKIKTTTPPPPPPSKSKIKEANNVVSQRASATGAITNSSYHIDKETANARKEAEGQVEVLRSYISKSSTTDQTECDGRGIYVYDLPSKFNKDLLNQCDAMLPWLGFCKYLANDGLGIPIVELGESWYNTQQHSLELIFHSRVLNHPCRTDDWEEARLFYVPYYAGLDALRWKPSASNDDKDRLSLELINWLKSQKSWTRNFGMDHVFVLGKISWEFRRAKDGTWGNQFLGLDEMQNPMKVLLERQPWHINDVAVPYPTRFHPNSDESIIAWQSRIVQRTRKTLIGFAGLVETTNTKEIIRPMLVKQCTAVGDTACRFLNCKGRACAAPASVTDLFLESEFCLQPKGESRTRKSVFDSLVAGCIPVFFDPFTAYYQYPWHLPKDCGMYSVFIDEEEMKTKRVNVVERLKKMPIKEREEMRTYIAYELLPRLIYADSDSKLVQFQDAFSITVDSLLQRVSRLP